MSKALGQVFQPFWNSGVIAIMKENGHRTMSEIASSKQDRQQRMRSLLGALGAGLYEREEAMRLALLSTVAGESIFLLGPPGVGKSLIARRLKYAFADGVSFEYLMSKFSTPDEVFGPVSIKKLKEEDKYERLTDRYLPGANIVFLDEIWKAGSAIQNALLTILNEKIYRNGDQDMQVNIRGIITASNELPPPNQNLAPIWDRFLLRLEMGNIRQFRNFLQMITDTNDVYADEIPITLKLKDGELEDWSKLIDQVEVPSEVLNVIQVLKLRIEEHNARPNRADEPIIIHDRRWKKMVRLMRTSAFLNGRNSVDLMDCFLMEHCLWGRPAQIEVIKEILTAVVREHGYSMAVQLTNLNKEVRQFEEDVEQETQIAYSQTEEVPLLVQEEYYQLEKEDQQFEGMLVSTKQFQQLQLNESTVTNFYDEQLNLVNRLKARKGRTERTIEVEYNSRSIIYPLRSKKLETEARVFKKPHPVVEGYWEERFQELNQYIEQQTKRISQEQPPELQGLDMHLFVAKEKAEIVSANLQEVKTKLEQLQLRLEKLRFSYTS